MKNKFPKFFTKIGRVFFLSIKNLKMLEAKSKKWTFASHGDFRGYLYEAPIFSIPTH